MTSAFSGFCIQEIGMLWAVVILDIVAGAVLVTAWYLWFARRNRTRSLQVLHWIQRVFCSRGEISGVQWISPSRFLARLSLPRTPFHQAVVSVRLHPREMPIQWLFSAFRHEHEALVFQADLDCAPCFNLEVHNHRWCGRARGRFRRESTPARGETPPRQWTLEHTPPFVLTTRNDWQREITQMMNALLASRECDCMSVCFRRSSPHFSATVPLDALSPNSAADHEILNVLRELATGASAARF